MRENMKPVIGFWAINLLLITLADEEAEWWNKLVINEEFIFDQDKY